MTTLPTICWPARPVFLCPKMISLPGRSGPYSAGIDVAFRVDASTGCFCLTGRCKQMSVRYPSEADGPRSIRSDQHRAALFGLHSPTRLLALDSLLPSLVDALAECVIMVRRF